MTVIQSMIKGTEPNKVILKIQKQGFDFLENEDKARRIAIKQKLDFAIDERRLRQETQEVWE